MCIDSVLPNVLISLFLFKQYQYLKEGERVIGQAKTLQEKVKTLEQQLKEALDAKAAAEEREAQLREAAKTPKKRKTPKKKPEGKFHALNCVVTYYISLTLIILIVFF